MENKPTLEDIVSLCKRRGFIYQGSDIYGGLAGTYDYGPLGTLLKRNIVSEWLRFFVDGWEDMYQIDSAILMNRKVWQASGHEAGFNDSLIECGTGNCNMHYRVDHLMKNYKGSEKLEDYIKLVEKIKKDFFKPQTAEEKTPHMMTRLLADYYLNDSQRLKLRAFSEQYKELSFERGASALEIYLQMVLNRVHISSLNPERSFSDEKLKFNYDLITNYPWTDLAIQLFFNKNIKCSNCGAKYWALPRPFNLMFKTHAGPIETDESVTYLRPETAQGMFVNYKNILDSFYPDLPFGIAQVGKAFRNEISPRDFIFRVRELEIMEFEFFIKESDWEKYFEKWRGDMQAWFTKILGLPAEKIKEHDLPPEDRAHYSKRTIDFYFDFPHGSDELAGLAYRTDFDLKAHQEASGKDMSYRPKDGSEPFIPHVIEPTFGLDRHIMAVLSNAYTTDEVEGEKRTYLKLPAKLAPVKAAVFPLLKNKPELVAKAKEVHKMLQKEIDGEIMFDDNGNIGKRYRRQDEIGTPHTITIDFQTLEDDTVTVRNRDTTEQQRVAIGNLISIIKPLETSSEAQVHKQAHWYAQKKEFTNSKGVTYYLNSKAVTLRGGKTQTIYFFSKEAPSHPVETPENLSVKETTEGLPTIVW